MCMKNIEQIQIQIQSCVNLGRISCKRMSSRKHKENSIFDFERPESPTVIQGSFSLSTHATLMPSDSLDEADSQQSTPSPKNSHIFVRQDEVNSEPPNKDDDKRVSFIIEDFAELSAEEQLQLAQERIQVLEKRLEVLERELRLSQERARKLASQGSRLRRLARSGDLFRRAQPSSDTTIDFIDKNEPLGKYITLSVTSISAQKPESNELEEESRPPTVPLYLRRFEGQVYALNTKGVTIGSNPFCGICIPEEASILDQHAFVRWNESINSFELSAKNDECVYISEKSDNPLLTTEDLCKPVSQITLKNQLRFRTGMVNWIVAPMPRRKMIISKLFDALREVDVQEFKNAWLEAKSWNEDVMQMDLNKIQQHSFLIHSNIEEDADYSFIDEESRKMPKMSNPYSGSVSYRDFQLSVDGNKPGKFALLHVAVDYSFFDGVNFLLEKGAHVNKQCGSSKLSPLHIAVRRNNIKITQLLLFYGADLELTDSRHLTALALAETYPLRKLLLASLMLCAAADGGDCEEVKRLIDNGISPNAKALCHKAPLHLASLNGHAEVVEFLLQNKAFLNACGGRRNRTALHYASIANNVEVVKILMKYNADQEIVDSLGYTALNLSNGGEICRMLHKNPLSLCLATQAGDIDEVRSILEAGSRSHKTSVSEFNIRKVSRTFSGRKISKNVTGFNLGGCLAVDQRNEQGHAPIHLAAAAGNLELVQLLVSHGASVDLTGGLDKWTALFYAALAGHAEVVGFLLAIGSDCTRVDAQGLNAIEHVEQNIDDLKEKIDNKNFREGSFDQENAPQQTNSLLVPAQLHRQRSDSSLDNKGQTSWMKKQITRLEHVLSVLQSGQQKLLNALEQRDLHLLKAVLENEDVKIDEPLTKNSQTTALCYAALSGMPEFVKILLQNNANPTIADDQFATPLHLAAKAGHEDVVRVLLSSGVDANIKTKSMKQTPLHIAALNSHEDIVRILVDHGADLDAKDTEGLTPFDATRELNIKQLIASGDNLFYVAIAKGEMDTLSWYVEKCNVPTNASFATGLSPLQVACIYEQLEVVEFLLQHEADINYQGGSNSFSALHLAVQRNLTKIAQKLVEAGARLSATDADGKTPFELAKSNAMRKVLVDARPYKVSGLIRSEEHNADSGSEEDLSIGNLCRICFDHPANTIVLPCGHQAFCKDCASHLEICAFDRRPISQIVPIFRVSGN